MIDTRADLRRAWAVLSRPTRDELMSFPLKDVLTHGQPCRVALGLAGERHLLIPAGEEKPELTGRAGTLVTRVRRLTFGGVGLNYVDVHCDDAEVFDQFDDVVVDVLTTIATSVTPARDAVSTIERWRSLFRSRLVRGLRGHELRGLFAELVVLDALLTYRAETPLSVWKGPLRQAHDFELADRCLEVKALGTSAGTVVIHGLSQLAAHDARPLDLVLVHVMEDDEGASISDLVLQIEAKAAPGTLRQLLDAVGWSSPPEIATEETFAVAEVLRVPVTDATPRLVEALLSESAVMDGVVRVTYEIERTSLLPHVVGSSLQAVAAGTGS